MNLSGSVRDLIAAWHVTIDRTVLTERAVIVFGHRGSEHVVLKKIASQGDEGQQGQVLDAFGGRGVVRTLEYVDGAVLLEQISPGTSLADTTTLDDDAATLILADVIAR